MRFTHSNHQPKTKPHGSRRQKKATARHQSEYEKPPPSGSLVIYCDGSCGRGFPGRGGWSFVVPETGDKCFGGEVQTTNNRMEILGAIEAISWAKKNHPSRHIFVYSDSQYLVRGVMQWMKGWKKRGWDKKESGKVKNLDLWQQIDELVSPGAVTLRWVKGHNGSQWNEIADGLAADGACQQEKRHILGRAEARAVTLIIDDQDGLPGCCFEDYIWEREAALLF